MSCESFVSLKENPDRKKKDLNPYCLSEIFTESSLLKVNQLTATLVTAFLISLA